MRHRPPRIVLPEGPVLAARHHRAALLDAEGEIALHDPRGIRAALAGGAVPIVCHAPATARRLGLGPFPAADLLELFAFARPAEPVVPSPAGLADALGLARPRGLEAEVGLLREAAIAL
ncbi:MAG: ATP-dependent DNA helicase, partial [Acetobacteraceae bacterium]